MRIRRRTTAALVVPLVAAVLAGPTAEATAAPPIAPPSAVAAAGTSDGEDVLRRPAQGEAAVQRLGDRLPEVAALNAMTAAELERLLLGDDTVWVHPSGLVYYVDPVPEGLQPGRSSAGTLRAAKGPYPYEQTFQLHSKPGSARTIYLDFDGQTVSGTGWNDFAPFLPAATHPAYTLDGSPAFSNAEKDAIQSIWQRVSEDYAPFDVDVTTADPGTEALRRTTSSDNAFGTRALITPSTGAAGTLCGSMCGGIAFMGTYDATGADLGAAGSDYAQPAWVFSHLLANDTKAIADAVSHEVGHNLNLEHDAIPGSGYFSGHGAWAPIMGSSYDKPIAQWSIGEYADATETQDDLAVMLANGLSYRADDHGGTVGSATPLSPTSGSAEGLIATRSDRDVFALPEGCTGDVTISVAPAPTSPNLDVGLRILRGDGSVVATSNPLSGALDYDVATGMNASATVEATSGTPLYAEVDGVGAGNPLTDGYSDYASIGRYTITSVGCASVAPARPDLLVSTRQAAGYLGDDVYNGDGTGQTKQVSAQRRQLRSFFVRLTNDGAVTDSFVLAATKAPKGSTITYTNEGDDIAALLTGTGGVVTMAPDQFALVRVDIKVGRKAKIGSLKSAVLTVVSDADGLVDVVRAVVKVRR